MDLYLKPVEEYEEVVHEFYDDYIYEHYLKIVNGGLDSGFDLFCLEDIEIPGRAYGIKIHLGLKAELTMTKYQGRYMPFYIYPRSSTGSKTPIRLSNSVGIIDAGYRGELMAIVDNISDEPFTLKKGNRYFQLCSANLLPMTATLVSTLSSTIRGDGGLGSTGSGSKNSVKDVYGDLMARAIADRYKL